MGEILFDIKTKTKKVDEQTCGSFGVTTLNLLKIQDPKPTDRMLAVLKNLVKYNFITDHIYELGTQSFSNASELIEMYQDEMHDYFANKPKRVYSSSRGSGYSEWTEMDSIGCECGMFW